MPYGGGQYVGIAALPYLIHTLDIAPCEHTLVFALHVPPQLSVVCVISTVKGSDYHACVESPILNVILVEQIQGSLDAWIVVEFGE